MTKIVFVTYCSRKKSDLPGELPAIDRYKSGRIERVYIKAMEEGVEFAVLSGKFGLLKPEDTVPYYDQLMRDEDVEDIKHKNIKFILENDINSIIYYTEDIGKEPVLKPYLDSIHAAIDELRTKHNYQVVFEQRSV